ncbi:MAG: hypothetical protein C4576_35440 [Desulfobacteraceae bacterium]|nr:MAG: hypothetical protein C4576_35440 [Desulfobacteraceae bacterium]
MKCCDFELAAETDRTEAGELFIMVPRIAPGPLKPCPERCYPLLPEMEDPSDINVYCQAEILHDLILDEESYRRDHPEDWVERCWFLLGNLVRDAEAEVWGSIVEIAPARHVEATAWSFEFTAETWPCHREELRKSGTILMGWVHTHSLHFLSGGKSPEDGEQAEGTRSGLFLSSFDVRAASKLGFSAPHHLTCVLDSDECLRGSTDRDLQKVLGVWGWSGVGLTKRNIHIVGDASEGR